MKKILFEAKIEKYQQNRKTKTNISVYINKKFNSDFNGILVNKYLKGKK